MRSVFCVIVLILNPTSQDVAPPDLRTVPAVRAPDDLGGVRLPDSVNAVKALFERLPAEVAGHRRSPEFDRISAERANVGYGEDARLSGARSPLLSLQAIDLSKEGFFPSGWSAGQVVAFMAGRGQEVKEAGRDGDLFWLRQETFRETAASPDRIAVYGALWGTLASPWIFSIQADARENRDALLAAFVGAVRASRP